MPGFPHRLLFAGALLGAALESRVTSSQPPREPSGRIETAADAIVAADGSGDYRTVQDAIDAVPQNTTAGHRWVIVVRAGTYREPRHLPKPGAGEMKQVFAGQALEAVLAAARRPPSNEGSRTNRQS